jgi:hypothetical protein
LQHPMSNIPNTKEGWWSDSSGRVIWLSPAA